MRISQVTLSNGVRMVMEEMPGLSSVTMGIWVKTGSVDEENKYSGISHFAEHMMFKGTHKRSAAEISEQTDRIGAEVNAYTGKEATCYYVKATTEHFFEAADVICDILEDSVFPKDELDRERCVILEELKAGEDSPEDVAHDNFEKEIFKGTALEKSVIGTRTTLACITRPVMRKFVDEMYTRDSILISIAGNFDPDEVCSFFEKRLTEMPASRPERKPRSAVYTPGLKSAVRDIRQCHICLGTKCVGLKDERTYAFRILSGIMGGSMSSRLFRRIREELGLCYTIYSSLGTFSGDGYFEIYTGVSPENAGNAILAIKDELRRLRDEPVPEKELASVREQFKSSYIFSEENSSSRMTTNGRNALLLGEVPGMEEVIRRYESVTPEDIGQAKEMICDFDTYSVSVVSGNRMNLRRLTGR